MAATIATKKPESPEAKPGSETPQPAAEHSFSLTRLRDEFDRLFHRFTRNWPNLREMGTSNWRWGVELQEKDDALVVKAEAPGFEPDDFDLRVEEHRLILRAARKTETQDKEGKTVKEQECYQSITLPCDVDKDKVDATYHNGMLTITMPKVPEAKGRAIPVKGM